MWKRIVSGVGWTALATLLRVASAVITLAILARQTDPATMGLYGIGWAVAAFGFAVSQSGAAQGLIAVDEVSDELISAARVLTLLLSAGLCGLFIFVEPLVSEYYKINGVGEVIKYGAAFITLMSLGAVDVALAQREMRFRLLAGVQTAASILASGSALILAWFGLDLLALFVVQGMVGFYSFIIFRANGFGRRLVRFRLAELSSLYRYGAHLSFAGITGVVWNSVPQIILGKFVSPSELGGFVLCQRVVQIMSSQLGGMINSVIFPAFVRIGHDRAEVAGAYFSASRFTYYCFALPCIVLIVSPGAFLELYGGSQWEGSADILVALAIMQLLLAFGSNAFPTFQALGVYSAAWRWNLLMIFLYSIAVLWADSVNSAAYAIAAMAVANVFLPLWLSHAASFSWVDWLKSMWRVVLPCFPACLLGYIVQWWIDLSGPVVSLLLPSVAAILLYSLIVAYFDKGLREKLISVVRH